MRHKHADLIHAWADGAQIQWESHYGDWIDENYPDWSEHNNYRVKPEPKPDVVFYQGMTLNYFADGDNCPKATIFHKERLSENLNVKFTFDAETGDIKSAEVIK